MDRALPTGTITFLFTDIEGSTRLVQEAGPRFAELLEAHDRIIRDAIRAVGGTEVRNEGDSFFAVFGSATDAVIAAVTAQQALASRPWEFDVRVRMGLHTGDGVRGGSDYVGLDVHRAARVASAAHGGQIVVTASTLALVRDRLPDGASITNLGRHRLKDIPEPEHLAQITVEGLANEFPPLRSGSDHRLRLPAQSTSFVGRREEVDAVSALLDNARMVTLTGPGGAGKTRLSLAVAEGSAGGFADGVVFVPLSAVQDPDLVSASVASALSLSVTAGDPAERVALYLIDRSVLLVLDNFEHVVTASPLVARWLHGCPGLKVLATSRSPLRVTGEIEYSVPPLGLPVGREVGLNEILEQESVALFVARARAVRGDFSLTEENAPAVAEIVTRLDGLPLAIELVAARMRYLTPEAAAARLASPLDLATGGARDLPVRQQTLRSAIEWSHSLLAAAERKLFARFSVFAGGAGLGEVEAVCGPGLDGDVISLLESLVDQSLLRAVFSGPEPRFVMLETIREFAAERLDESEERESLAERHLATYLAIAEAASGKLTREGSGYWLDRLEADLANLRSALDRSIALRMTADAQRLVVALWRFWQMRGHLAEGRRMAGAALQLPGAAPALRARALEAAAGLAYWQADIDGYLTASEEMLEIARPLGEDALLVVALNNLALGKGLPDLGGDVSSASPYFEEGLEVARRTGDPETLGTTLWTAGTVRFMAGEAAPAEALFDEALASLHTTDAVFMQGWSHRMRGVARLERGDVSGAEADLRAGLEIFGRVGDLSALALHFRDLAAVALARGQYERSITLGGAVAALEQVSETRLVEWSRNALVGTDEAVDHLGDDEAAKALAAGRAMSPEQAIAYAASDS